MISSSGARLLPQEAIQQLIAHLLPHTTILTPNIPEANFILSQSRGAEHDQREIRSVADLEAIARSLQSLGPKWVLVKGGHCPFSNDLIVEEGKKEVVVDVLVGPGGEDVVMVHSPFQESTSTHGTGCTLACKCL
jgi:hydroxymethylpyrimidine/phosphomethylpyrimidine kinase / thiaminase